MTDLTRRAVITAACAGCAVVAAGCSSYGQGRAPAPAAPPAGGGAGGALVNTANVPVGGGVVLAPQNVVITQPTEGEFKAFSATCTHQGCAVTDVTDGTINCPCHGSKYAIADGSVVGGPAPSPLAEQAITVEGDSITLA